VIRAAGTGVGLGVKVGEGIGVIVTVGVRLAVGVGEGLLNGELFRKLQPEAMMAIKNVKINTLRMFFMMETITEG